MLIYSLFSSFVFVCLSPLIVFQDFSRKYFALGRGSVCILICPRIGN